MMFFDRKSQRVIEGTREEVLNILKSKAKSNCKKCFGRGYIGYKVLNDDKEIKLSDDKEQRLYIPCPKCSNK